MKQSPRWLVCPLLLTVAACTGSIDGEDDATREPPGPVTPGAGGRGGSLGPGASAGSGGMVPGPSTPFGSGGAGGGMTTPVADIVGAAPMRRLNRREYNNVVKDLLGDTSRPADSWTAEAALSGFDTDTSGQDTTQLEVDAIRATAEQVAGRAVQNLTATLGCDPKTAGEEPCGSSFIDRFGARAYRRPLTADQKARLKAVFDLGRASGGMAEGVRLVIETVLQSPYFLYRPETGDPAMAKATRVPLTSHEVATRLAFFLTGTAPDDMLRAAADANMLRTPEAIETHARRLLAKPEAKAIVATFHHQWLHFERLEGATKNRTLYPDFSTRLVGSLEAGTRAFVQHLYVERADATLEELFTAPYTFVDGTSAKTYGLPASMATTPTKTMLMEPRSGLLTDAALMAALASATETQPVGRGAFLREKVLCLPVAPPPANEPIEVPPPNPNLTTRERYAMHRDNPNCAGCHALLDPPGFAFENYDAIGRYRATENGKPIDASGEVVGIVGLEGKFNGALELGKKLVTTEVLRKCLVESWMTFGLGRRTEAEDDASVAPLTAWLGQPQAPLRELLVAIAKSPAFRFRPPVTVEACR